MYQAQYNRSFHHVSFALRAARKDKYLKMEYVNGERPWQMWKENMLHK